MRKNSGKLENKLYIYCCNIIHRNNMLIPQKINRNMLHAIHFSYRIGPINVHKPEFSLACTSSGQALNQKKHHSSDKYSLRTCILLQYDLHKLRYRVMCAVLISNRTKKFTHMSFSNLYVIWTSIGSDKIAV